MKTVYRTDSNDEVIVSHVWKKISDGNDETFPYKIEVIEAMGATLLRFIDEAGKVQCAISIEDSPCDLSVAVPELSREELRLDVANVDKYDSLYLRGNEL